MKRPIYRPGPYQIRYDFVSGGTESYCQMNMDLANAEYFLQDWKDRYLDPITGEGKAYPNGKGYYPFRNPRIEQKTDKGWVFVKS